MNEIITYLVLLVVLSTYIGVEMYADHERDQFVADFNEHREALRDFYSKHHAIAMCKELRGVEKATTNEVMECKIYLTKQYGPEE